MQRPSIAFFTPLNPQRGGISDHSEELLPEIAKLADVDIVIGPGYRPTTANIVENFNIIDAAEFLKQAGRFDIAIYQLGNNYQQHSYMLECMRAVPGIVVLQDYCLQYLMLPTTIGKGDLGALRQALEIDYNERAGALARLLLFSAVDPNSLCFAGPFLQYSRGVMVHSRHLEALVRAANPSLTLRNVTMGVTIGELLSREQQRSRHGYDRDDFVIGTLSTLVPKKNLMMLLETVYQLGRQLPELKLLVVGGGTLGAEARNYIERQGLWDRVRITGWVPEQDYRELTAVCDAVVDVRETSAGETANSLLRAFAAGKPGIVSGSGVFLELPDEICIKVDVDSGDRGDLTNAVSSLYHDRARLQAMSRAARDFACSKLTLRQSAQEYLDFIAEVVANPVPCSGDRLLQDTSPSALGRYATAFSYRLFRLGHLYRNYGLIDTVRRVRRELSSGV